MSVSTKCLHVPFIFMNLRLLSSHKQHFHDSDFPSRLADKTQFNP